MLLRSGDSRDHHGSDRCQKCKSTFGIDALGDPRTAGNAPSLEETPREVVNLMAESLRERKSEDQLVRGIRDFDGAAARTPAAGLKLGPDVPGSTKRLG